MKIAVAGKGGSGKTTVAAAIARTLAQEGVDVIAVDADANPNLGVALGLGPESAQIKSLKNELYEHDDGHDRSEEHDIDHLVRDFGVRAPDGIRLLQIGTVERPSKGCLCCGSHATLRDVFDRIPAGGRRVVITDLEAGVNDLLWAKPRPDDRLIIVVDPSQKSLLVGARIHAVAKELGIDRIAVVANRTESDADLARARTTFPGVAVTAIPDDPLIREADRVAQPAIDMAETGPAVPVLRELANRLWAEEPAIA
jgi:CO dehydrogenase maturation factor